MSEPIFFVSHFRIKEGRLDALRRMSGDSTERLRAEKPRTVLFLSYIDEDQGVVSFLHAFEDADAMDLHFEGADERSRTAYELIDPIGWEFYGRPSPSALETMRQAAASTGATLSVQPEYLAGFLRLAPDPA
jgi:quinol monooxygenase YgiN